MRLNDPAAPLRDRVQTYLRACLKDDLVAAIVVGFVGWLTHVIVLMQALEQSDDSGDTKPK